MSASNDSPPRSPVCKTGGRKAMAGAASNSKCRQSRQPITTNAPEGTMNTAHTAIRVDMENNADEFWSDLRKAMPHVATSLEKNGCAVVSHRVLMRLDSLGAFNGQPSPLIDYGSEGDGWADVVASRHEVIDA